MLQRRTSGWLYFPFFNFFFFFVFFSGDVQKLIKTNVRLESPPVCDDRVCLRTLGIFSPSYFRQKKMNWRHTPHVSPSVVDDLMMISADFNEHLFDLTAGLARCGRLWFICCCARRGQRRCKTMSPAISIPNTPAPKDWCAVEKTIIIPFHLNPEATNKGRAEVQNNCKVHRAFISLYKLLWFPVRRQGLRTKAHCCLLSKLS